MLLKCEGTKTAFSTSGVTNRQVHSVPSVNDTYVHAYIKRALPKNTSENVKITQQIFWQFETFIFITTLEKIVLYRFMKALCPVKYATFFKSTVYYVITYENNLDTSELILHFIYFMSQRYCFITS